MQGKDQKIRIGILGFGSRGVSLAKPLLDNGLDVELKWIIDPDLSQAKFFFGKNIFDPKNDLIKMAHSEVNFVKSLSEVKKDEIDALLLTAPEKVRTMVFKEALDFNIPVLMEKALSNSLEGSASILKTYQQKPNAKVFMAFNLRYNPLTIELKKLLDNNSIGRILYINYIEKIEEKYGLNYYRRFAQGTSESGGMLVTKSCHDFDLVNYILGDKPARVFASCRQMLFGLGGESAQNSCHTCPHARQCEYELNKFIDTRKNKIYYNDLYLAPDSANSFSYVPDSCVYKKSELTDMNNVIVDYQQGARLNYSQVLFSANHGREISIFGTDGMIQYNLNDKVLKLYSRWNNSSCNIQTNSANGNHGGADSRMINDFMEMVRTGSYKGSDCVDGAWALAMGVAAYKSSKEEKWINVKEIANEAGIIM